MGTGSAEEGSAEVCAKSADGHSNDLARSTHQTHEKTATASARARETLDPEKNATAGAQQCPGPRAGTGRGPITADRDAAGAAGRAALTTPMLLKATEPQGWDARARRGAFLVRGAGVRDSERAATKELVVSARRRRQRMSKRPTH